MNPNKKDFDERTLSSFGVSVGTGLMLESLFTPRTPRIDDKRTIPNDYDLTGYTKHYINAYTLIRNIMSSVRGFSDEDILTSKYLAGVLIDEMEIISRLYDDVLLDPVFYLPVYKDIMLAMNIGKPNKKPTKSRAILDAMYKIRDKISIGLTPDPNIIKIKYKLKKENTKALITTHIAVDLCNYVSFNKLVLLESNTGKFKEQSEWWSKFKKDSVEDLSVVPFSETTMYLFGDGWVVMPISTNERNTITGMLLENGVNPNTSYVRMTDVLKQNKDIYRYIRQHRKVYV
jgi:hypothetical protein